MHDKPLFGFDIGHASLKVMQLEHTEGSKKLPEVVGYGTTLFEPEAIVDGVIVKPDLIAKSTLNLFKHRLIGDITTNRVAMAIPSYRSYSRSVQLPQMKPRELEDAIRLEVEQYTPLPLEDLYLDYKIIATREDINDIFVVAMPKKIIDSYVMLANILGLEPILLETTMSAAARLFSFDSTSDIATVIIDFGSLSSDISIFREDVLVTGTIPAGGLVFTRSIAEHLKVTESEAATIKVRYGLGVSKKRDDIVDALEPTLSKLAREIRRMVRYYEDRYGGTHPIGQVLALGGGANMPGLADFLTNELRLPVRSYDPWQRINSKHFQLPARADHPMFATVTGLSLATTKGIFGS